MAPNSVIEVATDAIDDAPPKSSQRNKPLSTKARENREIEMLQEKSIETGTKASKRTNRATTANGKQAGEDRGVESADSEMGGWQKVLAVIVQQQETIEDLKKIVVQQQDTIQNLHERLKDTQAELKQVHDQLDAISGNVALNTLVGNSPNPSYADVARTPPNSAPANIRSISSMGTTPSTMTDTLYCTVDTSRVVSEDADKVSAGAIRTTVEKEMRDSNEQANWRCQAVTKDLKNPH